MQETLEIPECRVMYETVVFIYSIFSSTAFSRRHPPLRQGQMVAAAIFVGDGNTAAKNGLEPQAWNLFHKPMMPAQPITLLDPHLVRRLITSGHRGQPRSNGTSLICNSGDQYVDLSSVEEGVLATTGREFPEVERLLALNTEELISHTLKVERERHTCPNVDRVNGSRSQPHLEAIPKKKCSIMGIKKSRRKRRRASRSVSPSPNTPVIEISRTAPGTTTDRVTTLAGEQPISMGTCAFDAQRMEAALRRASHETRLLRSHFDRILGKDATQVSKNDARRVISFILGKGAVHIDFDPEKTIRLSSSVSSSSKISDDLLAEHFMGENRDDSVEFDHGALGGGKQAVVISSPSECLPERGAPTHDQEGRECSKRYELAREEHRLHDNQLDDQPVVDRKRLVKILTTEELINIMANHLGSAGTAWFDAHLRHSPLSNAAVGFPPLSMRGTGTSNEARAYTYRKEEKFLPPPKGLLGGVPVVSGMAHGPIGIISLRRRKRSRSERQVCKGDSGQRREGCTLGGKFEQLGTGTSMRSRSTPSAIGQESPLEPGGGELTDTYPSLTSLEVSRLNGRKRGRDDKFDRFGGRETLHALRGYSVGGGKQSEEAIAELRRQLEITKGRLVDLRALVRADIAWVQETVCARMSCRARASCCRWGSEIIAELTRRWEKRSVAAAMVKWIRLREYMINKELVKAFLKRKGAVMMRYLLEVWGVRLTSSALKKWRRRTKVQRWMEQAIAAKTLQRFARGFLGRRKFSSVVKHRKAILIQKVARGKAGKRRAANIRDLMERNAAAAKIQRQAKKRGERQRGQRIAVHKRRRRAAVKIQKATRGLIERRRARTAKQDRVHNRMCTVIQAMWRGFLGRRKARSTRVEMEAKRNAEAAAAIHIQTAHRKKAAKVELERRRRIQMLKYRQSIEKAAAVVQRVVKRRAARLAAIAVARKEERKRVAAAVHIQRIARGREARMRARHLSISNRESMSPRESTASTAATHPTMATRTGESGKDVREAEDNSKRVPESQEKGAIAFGEFDEVNVEGDVAPASTLIYDAASVERTEDKGEGEVDNGDITDIDIRARGDAATCIQALFRGNTARTKAHHRKSKRLEEETRRAAVWGEQSTPADREKAQQERRQLHQSIRMESGQARTSKHESEQVLSGASTVTGGRYDQSAIAIQAVYRGGQARWEVRARRLEREKRQAEARARVKEKRERAAATKIQTQARVMAAKRDRALHRARHDARVGSIRESGRAAADDLRALSRPGTAAEKSDGLDATATLPSSEVRFSEAVRGDEEGEWSASDMNRIRTDIRRDLEGELQKELTERINKEMAARMDTLETERQRVLQEVENARHRDRETVEEVVRSVVEAHNKEAKEITLIKAKLDEDEAARRENDASKQEYEKRLAELREEATAEAERSRLATKAMEDLQREMRRNAEGGVFCQQDECGQERGEAPEEDLPEVDLNLKRHEEIGSTGEISEHQRKEKDEEEHQRTQALLMQQLAAEAADRERAALSQLQMQLREEEGKRLEAHAAWEARQAEEEAKAKEKRRAEVEALESFKRQMEEDKIQAQKEQELRVAELSLQMDRLRVLQEKADEQERVRLDAERATKAEVRAREEATIVKQGAKLIMQDGDDLFGEGEGESDHDEKSSTSSRSSSAGAFRSTSNEGVEATAAREIQAVAGSRLDQVEVALRELAKKQEDLERREKAFEEARSNQVAVSAPSSTAGTAESFKHGGRSASTPEQEPAGGTASSSMEASLAPQSDVGSEALDGVSATSGGGSEWVEYWDESAGARYYYNTITQEASWTNPREGLEVANAKGGLGDGASTVFQSEDVQSKWIECLDEASGAMYYYNAATGEAVWEKPTELQPKTTKTATKDPQLANPEEWVCFLDDTSGEEYWFNVSTGETRWAEY